VIIQLFSYQIVTKLMICQIPVRMMITYQQAVKKIERKMVVVST